MSLDIVIPAHNEEQRIERTLYAYRTGFPQSDVRFHVALDGCHDRTADVVRRHVRDNQRVVLHEYPKLGKGGVLMETFRRCDADLVGFVDADCATPPGELARMTEQAADNDGVIASRRLPASVTPRPRRGGRSLTSTRFHLGCAPLVRPPVRRHPVRRQDDPSPRRGPGRAVDVLARLPLRRRPARPRPAPRLRPRRGADRVDRPGRVEGARRRRRRADAGERAASVGPPPHDAGGYGAGAGTPPPGRRATICTAVPVRPDVALIAPYPRAMSATAGTAASPPTPPTSPTPSPTTSA